MKLQRELKVRHLSHRLAPALLLFAITSAAAAATVRGRLDRVYANGVRYPAVGVAVTLYGQNVRRSAPAYTGPDGLYYLYNIPPGSYYLEVWTSRDPGARPAVYPVSVREPYTDVAPIVVH